MLYTVHVCTALLYCTVVHAHTHNLAHQCTVAGEVLLVLPGVHPLQRVGLGEVVGGDVAHVVSYLSPPPVLVALL